MDANTRELTRAINDLTKAVQGPRKFDILGNSDRINRDNREVSEESVRSTVRSFEQITTASRNAIRNEQKRMDSFFKGLSRSAGILDGFYHRVRKSNEELDKVVAGQSETFKRSAKNMEAFTRSSYNNTKKMDETTKALDNIDAAARKLQEKSKKKVEIEQNIQELTNKYLKKQVELNKTTDNYSTEQERIYRARLRFEKRLASAKEDEVDGIKEAIENLEKARKMLVDIQKTDSFEEFRSAIKGIEGWEKSDDEHLKEIYNELKDAGGTNEQILAKLGDVVDAIDGAKVGHSLVEERNTNKLIELSEKRNRILEALGPQIVAGLADASRRELSMLQTRQQRMGTQSFAMLPRAMAMGMSETDLLTMTDENRYLIRRLALAAGEEGEIAYMRGDFRREVQDLGKELGLIGADAMRGMLEIADSLRVVGLDANTETLRGMTAFLKDSQVRFGVTQEQMVSAFRDMTEEGLMGIRFMNRDDSIEAMQEEIAARMHLGRLLNQDIETMKRREREMAARVTGDPAEVFRRSIMAGILASQQGFSREDQDLIRRRFRGETISDPALAQRAMRLELDLRTTAAQTRSSEVVGGNLLGAIVTHRFMEMTGIDIQEATLEAQRRMVGEDERMARSDEPARRLNEFSKALMRAREMLRGITESSFSLLAASIFSSVAALAHLTFHAWAAGLSLGRMGMGPLGPGGRPKAAMGTALRGIPFAAGATGAIMGGMNMYTGRQQAHAQFDAGLITELERNQQLRSATYSGVGQIAGTMGGALAGAKAGAALGSFAPGIGTAIGGIVGAGIGYFAGDALGSLLADASSSTRQDTRREILNIATGKLGGTYGMHQQIDGSLQLHRSIMGEDQTRTLNEEDSNELMEAMQEAQRLRSRLESEAAAPFITRQGRQDMEDRLQYWQEKIVAITGFDPTETEKTRSKLFELISDIDRLNIESRSQAFASVGERRGMRARYLNETFEARVEARDRLIEKFSGIDDENLALMFEDEDMLIHVLNALKPHRQSSTEVDEIMTRLIDVLQSIDSNTERSANAEEESLSQLRKQLGMASESYWQERIGDVRSGVEEMSRSRDISPAF